MNKLVSYFFSIVGILFLSKINAQLAAPDLRCVSVNTSTSTTLTWIIPPDPLNQFTQYQIWSSSSQTGPYAMIGTINTYTQTSYTQSPTNANLQSQYYYVTTISGTLSSLPSDTLRSIFLNLSNPGNGVVSLNWNAIRTPTLMSSAPTYTVSRKTNTGVWSTIYIGNRLTYKDTIMLCKVVYNYKVEISDALGCVSQSNINGDTCYNVQPPAVLVLDSVSVDGTGQTTIGWPPSSATDVNGYIIYKSVGGFLTAIDTIYGYNNTSFTYTASSAGFGSEGYCVAAVDSCKNYSIPSLTHSTLFLSHTYNLCSRTANLNWTSYANLPKGILKYDVYCSINGGLYSIVGSSNTTTFSHSHLNPGDLYCYYVRVRNTDLSISAASNIICLTASAIPGPSYVYINHVSVHPYNKYIEVKYSIDTLKAFKSCDIYKSIDGINFNKIAVVSSTQSPQTYIDRDVKTSDKNYFYKVQVTDSCDNPGVVSNISKSILLSVQTSVENLFNVTITWDNYSSWLGGVNSYNIYRAIDGVFNPTPISNVPVLTRTYVDNVQDYVNNSGKITYYVEAVEGSGNMYGFLDSAKSNPADAYLEVNVFVPNAFAPHGVNNVWLPISQYVEKTDYKVSVFNRWGDVVFSTNSDTQGWDGHLATDDIYAYLIEYKNARGEFIQLKGHITVVK